MMFPDMSTEQLVQRRRELLVDMTTEYVLETRTRIRGAILLINAELQERRGYTYTQEDMRFQDSLRERLDHVGQFLRAENLREHMRTQQEQSRWSHASEDAS